MWGRNAWLLLTDLDELFSSRVPASVTDMLRDEDGCLLNGPHNHIWLQGRPEQVYIGLFDVYCAMCGSSSYAETQALANDESVDVLRQWTIRCAYVCANAQYNVSSNHRDKERTTVNTGWKSMVDPDSNLFKYSVHEGNVAYQKWAGTRSDNQTCAYLGHLRNAFHMRIVGTDFEGMPQAVTDWHWPL